MFFFMMKTHSAQLCLRLFPFKIPKNKYTKLFQRHPDILGEAELLHGYQTERIFSQEKSDWFKCSPIPLHMCGKIYHCCERTGNLCQN